MLWWRFGGWSWQRTVIAISKNAKKTHLPASGEEKKKKKKSKDDFEEKKANSQTIDQGAAVAQEPNSETVDKEPTASAGFLGRGKLIISCTAVGSEETIEGESHTDGKSTNDAVFKDCDTVTAPQNHVSHLYTMAHENTVPLSKSCKEKKDATDKKACEVVETSDTIQHSNCKFKVSLGGQRQCAVTGCVTACDFLAPSTDEFSLNSDVKSCNQTCVETTKSCECTNIIPTHAIYDQIEVTISGDCTATTCDGHTQQTGIFQEAPNNFCNSPAVGPTGIFQTNPPDVKSSKEDGKHSAESGGSKAESLFEKQVCSLVNNAELQDTISGACFEYIASGEQGADVCADALETTGLLAYSYAIVEGKDATTTAFITDGKVSPLTGEQAKPVPDGNAVYAPSKEIEKNSERQKTNNTLVRWRGAFVLVPPCCPL